MNSGELAALTCLLLHGKNYPILTEKIIGESMDAAERILIMADDREDAWRKARDESRQQESQHDR